GRELPGQPGHRGRPARERRLRLVASARTQSVEGQSRKESARRAAHPRDAADGGGQAMIARALVVAALLMAACGDRPLPDNPGTTAPGSGGAGGSGGTSGADAASPSPDASKPGPDASPTQMDAASGLSCGQVVM